MRVPELYQLGEATKKLGRSERWLREWLRKNPTSESGMPYYGMAGRTYLFTDENLRWITRAIEREAVETFGRNERAKGDGGVVYFIEGGEFIKIGFTRSPEARSKHLMTDSPYEPKVLHLEPGTYKTEKLFHRQFAHLRVRGEWFRKGPELLDYIAERVALFPRRSGRVGG